MFELEYMLNVVYTHCHGCTLLNTHILLDASRFGGKVKLELNKFCRRVRVSVYTSNNMIEKKNTHEQNQQKFVNQTYSDCIASHTFVAFTRSECTKIKNKTDCELYETCCKTTSKKSPKNTLNNKMIKASK